MAAITADQQSRWGIDSFWLKLILCVLMVLDHLYRFLPGMPEWFPVAGRVVAPTFVFLMTQGMIYTRNRTAYIIRFFLFGGAMLLGNLLIWQVWGERVTNSILISLGLSAALLACLDKALEQGAGTALWLLGAVSAVLLCTFFEGGYFCPVLALVFYYLRRSRFQLCAGYLAASVFLLWTMWPSGWKGQAPMLLALIPILLYNGRRGWGGTAVKYGFYAFYPLHIWVIFLLSVYLR